MTCETPSSQFAIDSAVLTPLAPGVHAFIQPDGGWCLSNAGLIGDGTPGDHLLLVDTTATVSRAQRLRDEVVRVAGRAPDLVVNTHFHGDHVFGNCVFTPDATVLGHRAIRDQIIASGLSLKGLWPQVDWGDVEVVAPSITFDRDAVVWAGDIEVHLLHLPGAHTPDDICVWLPRQRVLFAGDIAMSGVTPFCLMGSIRGCVEAVERLQKLDPLIVVPGHGPAGDAGILEQTRAYLTWLDEVAQDGLRSGRDPLEQARRTNLGRFSTLVDPERLVGNLHRAYYEIRGAERAAPIDIERAFTEMVTWNGKLPPCHA